jgi:hypothetical protein
MKHVEDQSSTVKAHGLTVDDKSQLKASAASSVFKPKPHKSDGLSKNARRLLKHANNLVGHYVEQILIRRYSIANSLAGGKAEVDLTRYTGAQKALSAVEKVPVQAVAAGAKLAGTFIQLLKEQESKHQLWLALFYQALGFTEVEFWLLAALVGSHVDEKHGELDVDAATARRLAAKWVLRFEVMLMNYSPCNLPLLFAEKLPAPSWLPEELALDKVSIQRIDETYRFAQQAFKHETRIPDSVLQKFQQGIINLFDSTEKQASVIDSSPVFLKSPMRGQALELYISRSDSLHVKVKGIYSELPDDKFSVKDFPYGIVNRLSARSKAPCDVMQLMDDQVAKVVAHWAAEKVFSLLVTKHFYNEAKKKLMDGEYYRKDFVMFFSQYLLDIEMHKGVSYDLVAALMNEQEVLREFFPRIERVAVTFFKESPKLIPYGYGSTTSGRKSCVISFKGEVRSKDNEDLLRLWDTLMKKVVKEDARKVTRSDIFKSKRSTGRRVNFAHGGLHGESDRPSTTNGDIEKGNGVTRNGGNSKK